MFGLIYSFHEKSVSKNLLKVLLTNHVLTQFCYYCYYFGIRLPGKFNFHTYKISLRLFIQIHKITLS